MCRILSCLWNHAWHIGSARNGFIMFTVTGKSPRVQGLLPLGQSFFNSASPGSHPHTLWFRGPGVVQTFAFPTSFQMPLPVVCRPRRCRPGPGSPSGIVWRRTTSLALLQPPSALTGCAGGGRPKPSSPGRCVFPVGGRRAGDPLLRDLGPPGADGKMPN